VERADNSVFCKEALFPPVVLVGNLKVRLERSMHILVGIEDDEAKFPPRSGFVADLDSVLMVDCVGNSGMRVFGSASSTVVFMEGFDINDLGSGVSGLMLDMILDSSIRSEIDISEIDGMISL
jgi:hypothetical protein